MKLSHEALLTNFDVYVEEVSNGLASAREHLASGQYTAACTVLATVTQRQAHMSVSVRAALIKGGYMEEKG